MVSMVSREVIGSHGNHENHARHDFPPRRFPYRGSAGEVMAGGAGANEREKARGGCPHTRRGRCEHRRRRCCAYLRFHNRAKRAVKRGFSVKCGLFCACLRYQVLSTYFILVIPVQYITLILPELRSGINRAARHTQARGDGAAAPHRAPCNMRGGCRAGRNTGGLATGGRHGNRGSAYRATGGFPQLASTIAT